MGLVCLDKKQLGAGAASGASIELITVQQDDCLHTSASRLSPFKGNNIALEPRQSPRVVLEVCHLDAVTVHFPHEELHEAASEEVFAQKFKLPASKQRAVQRIN